MDKVDRAKDGLGPSIYNKYLLNVEEYRIYIIGHINVQNELGDSKITYNINMNIQNYEPKETREDFKNRK